MPKSIVTCHGCGKKFEVQVYRKDTAKFCSRSCKGNWMSKNIVGEKHPMYNWPIREETRKKLIESHKGVKQSKETIEKRASQMRGEKHPGWKGGNIVVKCQECSKEISVRKSEAETRKFCSRACQGAWRSKHLVGEKAARWAGGKITKKCEECGKDFEVPQFRKDTAKFCSPSCKGKWMSKNFVGETHPLHGRKPTEE
jgi:endogenous inhibitor of DNA gyrase (YacG/DUF329 family)